MPSKMGFSFPATAFRNLDAYACQNRAVFVRYCDADLLHINLFPVHCLEFLEEAVLPGIKKASLGIALSSTI